MIIFPITNVDTGTDRVSVDQVSTNDKHLSPTPHSHWLLVVLIMNMPWSLSDTHQAESHAFGFNSEQLFDSIDSNHNQDHDLSDSDYHDHSIANYEQ
jgi:hypothetical protein